MDDSCPVAHRWETVAADTPIPLLTRRRVLGERMLLAKVSLGRGCHVALHRHASEQMAVVLSGRVRWNLGEDGSRKLEMGGGEVLHIPGDAWHGLDVLEDAEIIDILSPPGQMGVDAQGSE